MVPVAVSRKGSTVVQVEKWSVAPVAVSRKVSTVVQVGELARLG